MFRKLFPCGLALLTLAACSADVDVSDREEGKNDGNVHVAVHDKNKGGSAVSVDVPGFKANVSLPSLDLGSHVDLDGIKLAPQTKVGGIDVNAADNISGTEKDEGRVRLDFTNPQSPGLLIDHYARSAERAGYGQIERGATSLSATKADKKFALQIQPEGEGSRGTITISGRD